MWDSIPDWVLPALGIFFGAGGPFAAFMLWRSESIKAPIDRSTANTAGAVAISSAASELVQIVMSRLKEQDNRADTQDKQIAELRVELSNTQSKLSKVMSIWSEWYYDLRDDWDIHRMNNEAPLPPLTEST